MSVEEILRLLDGCVFLRIPQGEKGPRLKEWQNLTREDMTEEYLRSLNHGSNIGVLLGQASGGLITIDWDTAELLEDFLSSNPQLRQSLISKGSRGGNVWVIIPSDYPRPGKFKRDGKDVGEWRADRNQTVIYGKHPSGCDYTNNGKTPIRIAFADIHWPEGVILPWHKHHGDVQPEPDETEEPENLPTPDEEPHFFTTNDAGRADRFVARYHRDIKYVPERALWLTWDGGRWKVDRDGALERMAVRLSRDMLIEAAETPGNDEAAAKRRSAMCTEALACGDRRNISDFLSLAKIDRRILLPVSSLDSDPWVVGAKNAVIELKTGKVREYSRTDYLTRTLGCDADPEATCPRWEKFMEEVLPDPELRHYVHKVLGYCLTNRSDEQTFFFLYGQGHNGKTKTIETLRHILNELAAQAPDVLIEGNDRGADTRRAAAHIYGARVIWASETEHGSRFNERMIKTLTGDGDPIHAAELYSKGFDYIPRLKLIIYGNHKPAIRGTDQGIWRRVRLIPFTQQFQGDACDRNLGDKLKAEASGVLSWLVRGCLLWQAEGLEMPSAVKDAVAQYRRDEDTLGGFLSEYLESAVNTTTLHSEVYRRYQNWADDQGLRYPLTSKGLASQLRERGYCDKRFDYGLVWLGVQTRK